MTVAESKILSVFEALRDGEDKPDGLNVNRSRQQPRQASDLPMASIYFVKEDLTAEPRNNPLGSKLTLRLRCVIWHGGTEETEEIDSLIEPIREYVVATVVKVLGRGCEYAGTEWEGEGLAEADFAAAAVDFTTPYATKRGQIGEML